LQQFGTLPTEYVQDFVHRFISFSPLYLILKMFNFVITYVLLGSHWIYEQNGNI